MKKETKNNKFLIATILSFTFIVSGCASQNTYRSPQEQQRNANTVIGGAAGAIAGNAIGSGKGNTAAIGAGSVIGAQVASGCKPTSDSVFGGIAGALIGSQVGNGNGKKIATAIGATVGVAAGNQYAGCK